MMYLLQSCRRRALRAAVPPRRDLDIESPCLRIVDKSSAWNLRNGNLRQSRDARPPEFRCGNLISSAIGGQLCKPPKNSSSTNSPTCSMLSRSSSKHWDKWQDRKSTRLNSSHL